MNMINISFTICGVVFLSFLMTVYFTKKNIPNIENKIFKHILIFSFFIPFSDMLYWFSCYYVKDHLWVIQVLGKIYLTFLTFWLVFLTYYVIVVTNNNSSFVKKYLIRNNNISYWPVIVAVIFSIIEWLLGFGYEFGPDGVVLYTTGDVYLFVVLMTASLVALGIFSGLIGRKNIVIRKAAPIMTFSIYIAIIFIIYCFNRTIVVFSLASTLTSYMMFLTIENPDIKLISALELAKNQAEKANQAKSDFLSSMSDEIRSPLNAIVGLSELINETDDLKEIHDDSKDILTASNNLLTLVNGLLDINKLEENRMELIEDKYNPLTIFNDLTRLINVRLDKKDLELRVNFADNIPEYLYGDSDKLKRIITNLLTNAVKYTKSGHINFVVTCDNEGDKCNLKIIVSDTGRGIKKEDMDKLFTRFYRLEEDRDSNIEGAGLGLSITKSLVDLMNGKITVESTYGVGSTFIVSISQRIVK